MENTTQKQIKALKFPSPLEVDRELYFDCPGIEIEEVEWFPAPIEVYWELYRKTKVAGACGVILFPATREVDR